MGDFQVVRFATRIKKRLAKRKRKSEKITLLLEMQEVLKRYEVRLGRAAEGDKKILINSVQLSAMDDILTRKLQKLDKGR